MSSKKPVDPKTSTSNASTVAASSPAEKRHPGGGTALSAVRSDARQQRRIVSVRNRPYSSRPAEEEAIVPPREGDDVLSLLDKWLADDSAYEEESWPQLREALDQARLSDRRLSLTR